MDQIGHGLSTLLESVGCSGPSQSPACSTVLAPSQSLAPVNSDLKQQALESRPDPAGNVATGRLTRAPSLTVRATPPIKRVSSTEGSAIKRVPSSSIKRAASSESSTIKRAASSEGSTIKRAASSKGSTSKKETNSRGFSDPQNAPEEWIGWDSTARGIDRVIDVEHRRLMGECSNDQ